VEKDIAILLGQVGPAFANPMDLRLERDTDTELLTFCGFEERRRFGGKVGFSSM
jgi:hypothetical protein